MIATERLIDLQPWEARIAGVRYGALLLAAALHGLTRLVRDTGQRQLWDAVQRFLRPSDILIADQGTAFFGAVDATLYGRLTMLTVWCC